MDIRGEGDETETEIGLLVLSRSVRFAAGENHVLFTHL